MLLGNTLATLGAFMQATAQGWLVLELTDSPGLLGLVGAIAGLPTLFLAVVAGVLADRLDRRRLLARTYAAAAIVAAVLALLTTTGAVAYWHVAVVAFVGGVLLTVQMPASQAIVSTVVDRAALGSAIALNSAQYNLMRIVGPSIAGLAIAAGGLALGFWANALALVVVAAIFARLPLPPTRAAGRLQAAMWGDLQDGVRHVAADPVLAALVLLAAAPALFVLSYLTFLPVYARDILAIGAPGLGLLTGSIGVGALAGALLMASLRPSGGSGRLLLAGLVSMSLSLDHVRAVHLRAGHLPRPRGPGREPGRLLLDDEHAAPGPRPGPPSRARPQPLRADVDRLDPGREPRRGGGRGADRGPAGPGGRWGADPGRRARRGAVVRPELRRLRPDRVGPTRAA